MILEKLIIKNVGPHEYLECNFTLGVNGIIGPNGFGKSTILHCINAALTNTYKRFSTEGSTKDDCIRSVASDDAYIYLRANHNGRAFEIQRGLRPNNNWLFLDGTEYKKAPDIEREMTKLLGTTTKLLDGFVLVAQGDLYKFISDTPAVRAEAFQVLCRTQQAKTVVSAVTALLESDPSFTTTVADNSADLLAAIAARQSEQNQAQRQLLEVQQGLLADSLVQTYQGQLKEQETRERLKIELEGLRTCFLQLASRLKTTETATRQAEADLAAAEQGERDLRDKAAEAKMLLTQLDKFNQAVLARDKAEKELLAAKAQLAAAERALVTAHPRSTEQAAIQVQITELRLTLSQDRKLLDTFTRTGIAVCPTCGTPVKQLDAHLQEVRSQLPIKEKQLKEAEALLVEIQSTNNAAADAAGRLEQADQLVAVVQSRRDALLAVSPVSGNGQELKETVTQYATVTAQVKVLKPKAAQLRAHYGMVLGQHTANVKQRQVIRQQLETITTSEADYVLAVSALGLHEQSRIATAAARQVLLAAETALSRAEVDLQQLRVRLERNSRALVFGQKLQRIKILLHPQALPQFVAQTNLQDLEAEINNNLALFGSPFTVETGENLTFTVYFPGMPAQSAARLSCGQRSLLALAIRPALLRLFTDELSFMALDEPCESLDASNEQYLAEAIRVYADRIRGRQQLLLVTHSQVIKQSLDNCIDLTPKT